MKIAYLFSRYPVPSQTFCDTEIRALEAAGHEVEIYSCSAPTTSFRHGGPANWPRAEVLYAPSAPVLEAWAEAARRNGTWPGEMIDEHLARFGPRYDPGRRAHHALFFADRLRRRGVEHLHVHFANRATHAALFIHALTGLPFSFTAHAQDFLVDLGNDDLLRLMIERAAFVVAVSDWSREALLERCPTAGGKIHRIYNGLPLDEWSPPPQQPTQNTTPTLKIFSVGRLIDFKGFGDLIAACRQLREGGVPFSCEIAGEGPLRSTLEDEAADLASPDACVRLLGLLPQAEVRSHLQACDVFALACRVDEKGACDVLPTVILEAMAAGKPVVSTRLAAVPEMVLDGQTGFLSPPGDPPALAQSLARIAATSAQQRTQMGLAGRDRLAERFSARQSALQLAKLFSGARSSRASAAKPAADMSAGESTTLLLFDRWPAGAEKSAVPDPLTLLEWHHATPVTRFLALDAGDFELTLSNEGTVFTLLPLFGFLPDDLVFETLWRSSLPEVHRLESWRAEVGGACDTAAFLRAARRALYLSHACLGKIGQGMHLHAIGPQALLCTWLLRRLERSRSASFFLPVQADGGVGMAGSTLRKLAAGFLGGWVAEERKLAASLGPNFRGDKPDGLGWRESLRGWSTK